MPPEKRPRPSREELEVFLGAVADPWSPWTGPGRPPRAARPGGGSTATSTKTRCATSCTRPGCRSRRCCPRTARRSASTRSATRSTSRTCRWRGISPRPITRCARSMATPGRPAGGDEDERYYAREQASLHRQDEVHRIQPAARSAPPSRCSARGPAGRALRQAMPLTSGRPDPARASRRRWAWWRAAYEPIELKFDEFRAPRCGPLQAALQRLFGVGRAGGRPRARMVDSRSRRHLRRAARSEPVTIYSETPPRLLRLARRLRRHCPSRPSSEIESGCSRARRSAPDAARLFRSRPAELAQPAGREGRPARRGLPLDGSRGPDYDEWPTRRPPAALRRSAAEDASDAGGGVEVVSSQSRRRCRAPAARFPAARLSPAGPRTRRAALPRRRHRRRAEVGQQLHRRDDRRLHRRCCARPAFVYLEEKPGRLDDPRSPPACPTSSGTPRPTTNCAPLAGRRRAAPARGAARPDRAPARRPEVAPFVGRLPRLLARPAQDRRHLARRRALSRLLPRRSARRIGARGDAALLHRTAPRRPAGAQHRLVGFRHAQRAPRRALRPAAASTAWRCAGCAAGGQRPRRPADPGQRAQGHGQWHHHFAGAARRVDHGAHPRQAAASAAAERAGGRAGHPRRHHHPRAARQAPHAGDLRAPATPRSIPPASPWRASTSWAAGATATAPGRRASTSRAIGKNGQPFAFHHGPAGRRQRRAARWPQVPATSASSSACCSPTSAQIARNLSRQLVGLRHRRAGALRRPRRRSSRSSITRAGTATACARSCSAIVQSELFQRNDIRDRKEATVHDRPSPDRLPFSRRQFLRGAGRGPRPAAARCDARRPSGAKPDSPAPPRRMLAICNNLGLLPDKFFPEKAGRDYTLSPYLEVLKRAPRRLHRLQRRLASRRGWRASGGQLLPHRRAASRQRRLPQHHLARPVRRRAHRQPHAFPVAHARRERAGGQRSLSWTGAGVLIPCEEKASDSLQAAVPPGHARARSRSRSGDWSWARASWMPWPDQAKELQRDVGARDRERLDQYFTGVRDLEERLGEAREWEHKPKPVVQRPAPVDPGSPREYMEKVRLMYDMARLAFETDSTRLHHAHARQRQLARHRGRGREHHRRLPQPLAPRQVAGQARAARSDRPRAHEAARRPLRRPQERARRRRDPARPHMVLYGSNLGNANTHVTTNLPVLFAGGGFKHGQHLAFDRERNYPLPNLFVSMLQRLGIEADKFADQHGHDAGPGARPESARLRPGNRCGPWYASFSPPPGSTWKASSPPGPLVLKSEIADHAGLDLRRELLRRPHRAAPSSPSADWRWAASRCPRSCAPRGTPPRAAAAWTTRPSS